ncbi:MAG: DUF2382 domain-containing protein [Gloeotrichia echinulata GP01]
MEKISENSATPEANHQITNDSVEIARLEKVGDEKIIRLLEERLVVNRNPQKIFDVIVRKKIETRMVQVPVRREKLIVEQVSPEHKQLAEIDLSEGEFSSVDLISDEIYEFANLDGSLTVSGLFSSPKIASLFLNAISLERNHGCQQVRVSIVVENEAEQKKYQEWFDRCSKGQEPKPEKSEK